MHPSASLLVTLGIGGLALLVAGLVVVGYARAARDGERTSVSTSKKAKEPPSVARVLVAVAAWVVMTGALGAAGALRTWDARPPAFIVLMVFGAIVTVWSARSRVGERVARGLPLAVLIGFHAFRLPLELVMHAAAAEGTMPPQMTFPTGNFDIVSGASAIVVALLVARRVAPRWLVLAWAVMSSALLAIIVVIAVASTPAFAAFGQGRVNTFVGFFPFVWLPSVMVLAALFGQLVVFRRLGLDAERSREATIAGTSR